MEYGKRISSRRLLLLVFVTLAMLSCMSAVAFAQEGDTIAPNAITLNWMMKEFV